MTEFLLAMWSNMKVVLLIGGLVGLLATAIVAIYRHGECDDAERPRWWLRSVVASAIAFSLLVIPDLSDLWRVRIALIKWHLAAPENIQKASETIERIGRKLECRYLGCEDQEKARGE